MPLAFICTTASTPPLASIGGLTFIWDPVFICPPPLEIPGAIETRHLLLSLASAAVYAVHSSSLLFFSVFFSLVFIIII